MPVIIYDCNRSIRPEKSRINHGFRRISLERLRLSRDHPHTDSILPVNRGIKTPPTGLRLLLPLLLSFSSQAKFGLCLGGSRRKVASTEPSVYNFVLIYDYRGLKPLPQLILASPEPYREAIPVPETGFGVSPSCRRGFIPRSL